MLWFPLFVNETKIGAVKVVREDDFDTRTNSYRYRWEVIPEEGRVDLTGTPIKAPRLHGYLTHRYADGAFVLMRKVLSAYERGVKKGI